MREVSRTTVLVIISLFILVTCIGQIAIYRTAFTGRATDAQGTAEILIYPPSEEVVNCTTVTTVANNVIVDNSAQAIAVNSSITTGAAVTDKTYCTARYNSNLRAPNGVAGKTFTRTYYINGSKNLYNNLNQVVIQLYYQEAWLTAKGQNEANLGSLYFWNGAAWVAVAGSTVNTVTNVVQGTSTSFGYFGLFSSAGGAPPPAAVEAAGGGGGGDDGGGGGGGKGPVSAKGIIGKAIEIIQPATKTVSAAVKKVIKYAAPVTSRYWPIIALASLLVVGMGVWVRRRRHHLR